MTRVQKRVLIVTIWLKRKNVLSLSEKKEPRKCGGVYLNFISSKLTKPRSFV